MFQPYSVIKFGCDWGIMVTASHNPKEDNGYKVCLENFHIFLHKLILNLCNTFFMILIIYIHL